MLQCFTYNSWNFFSRIEKSRTIIPKLKTALSGPRASSVNLSYFLDLLFHHKGIQVTKRDGNLKLVHIACHDKKPHECSCQPGKIFLEKQGDDIDGPCLQHNHQSTRRGVKRAWLDCGYYTRSKRMQMTKEWCIKNDSWWGCTTKNCTSARSANYYCSNITAMCDN